MKKFVAAAPVLLLLSAGSAYAQAQNFAGFQVGLALDHVTAEHKQDSNLSYIFDSTKQPSNNPSLSLQYNFQLGSNWILGAGFAAQSGESDAGQWLGTTAKLKNVSNGFGVIGYAGEYGLFYGKLAAVSADTELVAGSIRVNKSLGGTGWGVGYQTHLSQSILFTSEVMINTYDKVDTGAIVAGSRYTPSSSKISLGLAYKF